MAMQSAVGPLGNLRQMNQIVKNALGELAAAKAQAKELEDQVWHLQMEKLKLEDELANLKKKPTRTRRTTKKTAETEGE